jgi:hypothetical protein
MKIQNVEPDLDPRDLVSIGKGIRRRSTPTVPRVFHMFAVELAAPIVAIRDQDTQRIQIAR